MLRERGYRMTTQRLTILQALHEGGHLSPAEIYQNVRQAGMTEATVYRILEFLAINGVVMVADRGNGHLAYELSGESHHHLNCRSCGKEVEIDPGLLEPAIKRIEEESGFHLNARHLTFFGLCSDCQSNPN
jgi:Fur family ferric uptake transcriptional regulator